MISRSKLFDQENKRLMTLPLQIIAALVVITGVLALMFEIHYFADFSIDIYFGRLAATLIGFTVLISAHFKIGRNNPIFLIHILLLTIIASFASMIFQMPLSLYVNSHLLALVIFTAALFLNWDLKNQIIVAMYYNGLFAASVLLSDSSIYILPSMFASVLFVMAISLMSIVASTVNYKLRQQTINKTFEAKEIIENSSNSIFKAALDGKIITVNPAFKKMFNLDVSEESTTINLRSIFTDEVKFDELIDLLKNKKRTQNYECSMISNNNELIGSIDVSMSEEFQGKSKFIDGSIHDITQRKLAEEKIKTYNAELENLNRSKDKFFSIVAHDLISPFTALNGYSEILAEEYMELSREQIGEFSKSINSVGKNAYNLLNELLDWSRVNTGRMPFEPEVLNLPNLVNEVYTLLNENFMIKSIKPVNNTEEDHSVFADCKMIHSTLRNLIGNAIKFTDKNGTITVSSSLNSGDVDITVEDTGTGISDEDIKKLFKIDIHHTQIGTTKEKGTGLGLILCKEFVIKNGGDIRVESKLGEGSKFIFSLPRAQKSK